MSKVEIPDALASLQLDYIIGNVRLRVALAVIVVLFGVFKILSIGQRDKRMPPGPPTLPILGNLHQIPITGMYRKFKEWGDQYGGVFSLKMGSGNLIVLFDRKAVHDLLDKKGSIYSERPIDTVASIVTGGDSFAFMNNTTLWRSERKVASHNLSPRMLDDKIQPIQEAEVNLLLQDLVETPKDFYHHLQRQTASVANIVVWGHRGKTYEDFWGSCVYKAMDQYSEALEPGANPPVDQFPILKLLPEFMSPWKTRAKNSYKAMDSTWGEARRRVNERRSKGQKRNCIVDRILDGEKALDVPLSDHQLNHFLGVIVEGGADTTASSMLTSIMMLALNPEYQRKAQKQIDAVVGSDRSPAWSDFSQIPYINSIVKEGMRWHPVLPLGVPHRVNQDDYYNGMLIPKDSTVLIPIWAMHFSEKLGYKNPDKYNPDRFADLPRLASEYAGTSDYMNRDKCFPPLWLNKRLCSATNCVCLHHYGYGAGRRICPGMHLAERTQWRITAKLLWAFNIEREIDAATGKPVEIDIDSYNEGISHCPKPFKVKFVSRSKKHRDVIHKEFQAAQTFLREYE